MTHILKYSVEPGSVTHVNVSAEAKFLHVAEQYDDVKFWLQVPHGHGGDQMASTRRSGMDDISVYPTRRFVIMATGESFDERSYRYCGTAICSGGALVWHLYEVAA